MKYYTEPEIIDSIDLRVRRAKRLAAEQEARRLAYMRKVAKQAVRNKVMTPAVRRSRNTSANDKMNDQQYEAKTEHPSAELNTCLQEFMNDEYTQEFINKCDIDKQDFLNAYLPHLLQAHELALFVYDNRKTLALSPGRLFHEFRMICKWPTSLAHGGRSYKTMLYYFRAIRNEFYGPRIHASWQQYESRENLFAYFLTWYFDTYLARLLVRRAKLVVKGFSFYPQAARSSGTFKIYPDVKLPELEESLRILHE